MAYIKPSIVHRAVYINGTWRVELLQLRMYCLMSRAYALTHGAAANVLKSFITFLLPPSKLLIGGLATEGLEA